MKDILIYYEKYQTTKRWNKMQINDNGFSIFVEKKDNVYQYYIKTSNDTEKEYIGSHKKEPIELSTRTTVGKLVLAQLHNYIPPNEYNDIHIYYNQIMQKLQDELKIQKKEIKEEKTKKKNYITSGYMLKDGIYWKIKQKNDETIYEYMVLKAEIINFCRISDYSNQTSNYFDFKLNVVEPNNHNEGKIHRFYGKKDDIIDQIMKNDLAWDELKLKEFIYKFTFENSERYTKQGVVGGYCSWNNIKKPEKRDITTLTNYLKNELTQKHLEVIKSLLLIPFHYILRHEIDYPSRKVVRFVVICGVPSAFKNGIVNIVRNMFDFYRTIPINEGGTPSSYASLRNAINDNIGFLMCDESNGVFLDGNKKFRNTNIAPVENLLKGIFQIDIPNVSSQTTGKNLTQHYNATPIFIWNDDFKKTEALKDRCICIEFKEPFNRNFENLFNASKQKKNLLAFGNTFAYCFRNHWEELRNEIEWEKLVDKILKYMQEEYDIDTEFLREIQIEEKETSIDIEEMFYNRMHYKFRQVYNIEAYIEGDTINHNIFEKLDIDFLYSHNSKSVYFYKNQFINYIRDKVAEDGGLTEQHIEEAFNIKTTTKSNRKCYRFDIETFMQKINKADTTTEEETEDILA